VTNQEVRKKFDQLRIDPGPIETETLDALFDTLEPISCQEMFGQWKGGELKTGHKGSLALERMNWFGKTFHSLLDVKPLICLDEQGEQFSSQAMGGEASLWMVEFRGKVSACMVYDGQPVLDHFRRVDDSTVMGIMDGKAQVLDDGKHFYFYLEKV